MGGAPPGRARDGRAGRRCCDRRRDGGGDVRGRYLLGVDTDEEMLGFLRQQADDETWLDGLEQRTVAARQARGRRQASGVPEGPGPVPDAWRAHLERVARRPMFQRLFRGQAWAFASVPIASLISVQPHLNHSFASRLAAPGEAGMLNLCLPAGGETLELWGGPSPGETPSASLFTRDPNIGVTSVEMEVAPELRITFTIGKTALFLQVCRLGGRLFLKNGTHRAVALAAVGVRRLPCVLVDLPDAGSLPRLLPHATLMGDAPPLVEEFLDPRFYVEYEWRDRIKFIRLVPEEFVAPLFDGEAR